MYPSEQQYYNAVMRKGWKGIYPSEIPEVVRIHNFVNERGWAEGEKGYHRAKRSGEARCVGTVKWNERKI